MTSCILYSLTSTGRWMNVWYIWHTNVEKLQEFRSRHRIGWTGFPGDVCVVLFNVLSGYKDVVTPNSSRRKKYTVFTTMMTSAYQDQLNAGFSKVCEIFKVCGIESLKYLREFHTSVCYCGNISTPRNVTLNETNCDWLFDISVKRHYGRALANKSCHGFQAFSRQSEGLATQDHILYYSHCLELDLFGHLLEENYIWETHLPLVTTFIQYVCCWSRLLVSIWTPGSVYWIIR